MAKRNRKATCFNCGYNGMLWQDENVVNNKYIGITKDNTNKCRACYAIQPRQWVKNEIKTLLENGNERVVAKAAYRLWQRQTKDEKIAGATLESNDRGFNACDAVYFTLRTGRSRISKMDLLARYVNSNFSNNLSPFLGDNPTLKVELLRRRLIKYSRQLTEVANICEVDKITSKK